MLNDSGAGIVLTQSRYMPKIRFEGEILDLNEERLSGEEEISPVNHPQQYKLCYLYFRLHGKT